MEADFLDSQEISIKARKYKDNQNNHSNNQVFGFQIFHILLYILFWLWAELTAEEAADWLDFPNMNILILVVKSGGRAAVEV